MTINRLKHILLFTALLFAGCATTPKAPLVLRQGAMVETLTASVGLSVKTPAGGTGGNGYLVYRKPDRFRMVMLTPFGTTAMEFCASGDKVTLALPSKGVGYTGSFSDIPERNGLQAWRLMKWAVEGDPLYDPAREGATVPSESNGTRSLLYYDSEGLLEKKVSEEGSTVAYREYESFEGVPFPSVIEFTDPRGTKVKITLKEPEINKPLDEAALAPNLEGLTILPIAEFPGT